MAVKLSSVSNGLIVKIPMIGGQTVDAVKVGSYGDAVILAITDRVDVSIADNFTFPWKGTAPNIVYFSFNSPTDLGLQSWSLLLAPSIREALVAVPIWTTYISVTFSSNRPTATVIDIDAPFYRSIFCPDVGSLGITSIKTYLSGTTSSYSVRKHPSNALSLSNVATYLQNGTLERVRCCNIVKPGTNTDTGPISVRYGTNDSTYGTGFIGDTSTYNGTTTYPFISLNGNIMVNSSSGGAITESTAVESYRKIGGKWYRTT